MKKKRHSPGLHVALSFGIAPQPTHAGRAALKPMLPRAGILDVGLFLGTIDLLMLSALGRIVRRTRVREGCPDERDAVVFTG